MTVSAPPRSPRGSHPVTRELHPPRPSDPVERDDPEALIEEARQRARRRRRRYVATGALVALVGLAIVSAVVGRAGQSETAPSASAGSSVATGSTSSTIAFAIPRGAGGQLFVVNPDGSGKRMLTSFPSRVFAEFSLAWSPEGRRIAFIAAPNGDDEIFVMNADGSGKRRLTRGPSADLGPTWSPDGRRIAFTRSSYSLLGYPGANSEVYVMNGDGSGQRSLARGGRPVWSPDGRQLAFDGTLGGRSGVFVVNVDGTGLRMLMTGASPVAWSPDGQWIIATRWVGTHMLERGPRGVLAYAVNADGSGQRQLPSGGGHVWSPDGRQIAFSRGAQPSLYVMRAEGTGVRELTDHALTPSWSPDGRTIAYLSDRSRNRRIHVINADGTGERKITDDQVALDLALAWSPAR